jgi:prepilin-type N-terminal cleavage/methylation domain-containing protein
MTRRTPKLHNRRGFTLLEALITLVLAGIVTAGVALALRTGLDASERMRERAEAHDEARGALDVLTADFSAAYLSAANTEETLFVGDAPEGVPPGQPFLSLTTLSYRSGRPSAGREMARSDAVRVEYSLEPSKDGSPGARLVRRERWLTGTEPGEPEVVCERVAGLALGYSDGGEFQESWSADAEKNPRLRVMDGEETETTSTRKLPRAVQVTLLLLPRARDAEKTLPRAYKTEVLMGCEDAAPFQPEVVFPPPPEETAPGQPDGSGSGSAPGGKGK